MGKVSAGATMSIDGYIAGPNETGLICSSSGTEMVTSKFHRR